MNDNTCGRGVAGSTSAKFQTEGPGSSPGDRSSAAQDQDVAVVRERLGYIEDKIVRAAVDGALARIEQRLIAGAAMAAVVDECVKAGHITAVPS